MIDIASYKDCEYKALRSSVVTNSDGEYQGTLNLPDFYRLMMNYAVNKRGVSAIDANTFSDTLHRFA